MGLDFLNKVLGSSVNDEKNVVGRKYSTKGGESVLDKDDKYFAPITWLSKKNNSKHFGGKVKELKFSPKSAQISRNKLLIL